MAQVADGTNRYIIVCALDPETPMVLDVSGASTANQANVIAHAFNGGNNQCFRAQRVSGDSTYTYIRCINGGKAVEDYYAKDVDGANIQTFTFNQSNAQKWYLVEDGTITVNGYEYVGYRIVGLGKTSETNNRVMDAADGGSTTSNVTMQTNDAGDDGQRWCFVPSSTYSEKIPVPTVGGCSSQYDEPTESTIQMESGTIWPSWSPNDAWSEYQLSYRTRQRTEGTSNDYSDWSPWKSYSDGSQANMGWGADYSDSNCETTRSASTGRTIVTTGLEFEMPTGVDRVDYQFRVRPFAQSYGSHSLPHHGGVHTWNVAVVKPVTISDITATITTDGITIAWEDDSSLGGGRALVSTTSGLFNAKSSSLDPDGNHVSIPYKDLFGIPDELADMTITVTKTTPDGAQTTLTSTVVPTIDQSGAEISASVRVVGTIAVVTPSLSTAKGWLIVSRGHSNRYVPLAGNAPWEVVPPLGVPWKVKLTGKSNGNSRQSIITFPAIREVPPAYHVTSQNKAHDLAITYKDGSPGPEFSPTYTRQRTEYETYGRERPVFGFGKTTAAEWTITGDLIGGDQLNAVDYFAHQSHVYFRSPFGFWAQSAVESVSIDLSKTQSHEVSVSLNEEVW